jgi:cytochrome c biogenesis protein CcmG/thiol:disulfide interchange protein DsbE
VPRWSANSGRRVSSAEKLAGLPSGLSSSHAEGDIMHVRSVSLVVTLIAVFAATAALGACAGSGSSASSAPVQFLSPKDFNVADYAGKPLVVNYFGSWCGPCNAEAPELSTFSKSHSGKAAFVGVAVNDQQSDVVDFMTKYGLSYPVVLDDNSLSARDGITGVPTTIFYNASGKEVDRIVGAASLDQFTTSFAKTQ